jgi:ABC-2 type transport system ATP-binding protein
MMSANLVKDGTALSMRNVTKVFGPRGQGLILAGLRRRLGRASSSAKSKEVVAVDGVNLEVRRNEIFGILGPNGSGKSTLIRLTATLLVPDHGEIHVLGLDVARHEMEVKRLINRVSVDAAFFKKLSGLENLMYAARLYGLPGREARQQAFAILRRLGLKDKEILGPLEDMSRGMQQKVAIARAFLSQPTLLLLDEPTTGLDPRSKREVQAFVRELRETHDATIVLTTHDMHEAEALCDRVAILDEGRIVALDTPAGLKKLLPQDNGREPTLEDVFMDLTGKELIKEEDRVAI